MIALLTMEMGKLAHLSSVRLGLVVLALFPWLWAYAVSYTHLRAHET